jgi:hypothetical protein
LKIIEEERGNYLGCLRFSNNSTEFKQKMSEEKIQFRPPTQPIAAFDEDIMKLMKKCWSHHPDKRPAFKFIAKFLKAK